MQHADSEKEYSYGRNSPLKLAPLHTSMEQYNNFSDKLEAMFLMSPPCTPHDQQEKGKRKRFDSGLDEFNTFESKPFAPLYHPFDGMQQDIVQVFIDHDVNNIFDILVYSKYICVLFSMMFVDDIVGSTLVTLEDIESLHEICIEYNAYTFLQTNIHFAQVCKSISLLSIESF